MKTTIRRILYTATAVTIMLNFLPGIGWCKNKSSGQPGTSGLQQRIDFGNSYILGQSIKSGAVYLLHRKQSEIKSMLQYRQNYRQEILEDFKVQDQSIADQVVQNQQID
jgi:hypothetical protein